VPPPGSVSMSDSQHALLGEHDESGKGKIGELDPAETVELCLIHHSLFKYTSFVNNSQGWTISAYRFP